MHMYIYIYISNCPKFKSNFIKNNYLKVIFYKYFGFMKIKVIWSQNKYIVKNIIDDQYKAKHIKYINIKIYKHKKHNT